jgi:hypothetical protein
MDFERLQKAWQLQDASGAEVNVNALLEQAQKEHRKLVRGVFWRDVREVAASFLGAGFCFWLGAGKFGRLLGFWPCTVAGVLVLGVGLFFIVDRLIQRRRTVAFGNAVKDNLELALQGVNHQIWLIWNVFWWYLLPGVVAWAILMERILSVIYRRVAVPPRTTVFIVAYVVAAIAFFYGVFRLNRRGVTKYLIPRREQLEEILKQLREIEKGND